MRVALDSALSSYSRGFRLPGLCFPHQVSDSVAHLVDAYRLDANRAVGNQAVVSATRVAFERVLQDTVGNPPGRQRTESEEPHTAIVGVPTAAARCMGPESFPMNKVAPRINSASSGIDRPNRMMLFGSSAATWPTMGSSPGPQVRAIVQPRRVSNPPSSANRSAGQRFVFHQCGGMQHHVRASLDCILYPLSLDRMGFVMEARRRLAPNTQPAKPFHCCFHGVQSCLRPRHDTRIREAVLIVLHSDSSSPCRTAVDQAGRPSMKVDDGVEPTQEKARNRLVLFFRGRQCFFYVRVLIETIGEPPFRENVDSKAGNSCLRARMGLVRRRESPMDRRRTSSIRALAGSLWKRSRVDTILLSSLH